jgi:hypothetical protein
MALSPEKLAEIKANIAAAKAKMTPPAAAPEAAPEAPPAAVEAAPPAATTCPDQIDPKIWAGLPEAIKAKVANNLINPPECAAGLQASAEKSALVTEGQDPEPAAPKKARAPKATAAAPVDLAPVIAAIQALQPVDLTPLLAALEANRILAERTADALEGILEGIAALA